MLKDTQHLIEEPVPVDSRVQGKIKPVSDDNEQPYLANLVKVDISYGCYSTNLFYKMQIYFEELRRVYILFTNWGRTCDDG